MDWNYFKYIDGIAISGKLSDASKLLGIDQSTLSRNLQRIERDYGRKVFIKVGRDYVPTEEGKSLVQKAREMKAILEASELAKANRKRLVVTSIDTFIAQYLLRAPMNFSFDLELIEADRRLDLAKREADVAIRFSRPEKGDFVIRQLAKVGHAAYAKDGPPPPELWQDCAWAALNDEIYHIEDTRWLRSNVPGFSPKFRTDSYQQILSLIETGTAVGILPCYLGDHRKGITRLPSKGPLFQREAWLVIHREMAHNHEVKEFKDWIVKRTEKDQKLLSGT